MPVKGGTDFLLQLYVFPGVAEMKGIADSSVKEGQADAKDSKKKEQQEDILFGEADISKE